MNYYYDNKRHLVCIPYNKDNLQLMAKNLGIKSCWFHKDHYDIPKRMISFVSERAIKISPREILKIIKDGSI